MLFTRQKKLKTLRVFGTQHRLTLDDQLDEQRQQDRITTLMSVIDSEAFCKASLEPLMADSAIGSSMLLL